MNVGSVSPEFIIATSAFKATRIAIWLLAPSMVPSIADTCVPVGLLDDLVTRGAPEAVVIADHQLERNLPSPITATGVALLDRELGALEHFGDPKSLLVALATRGDDTVGEIGPMKPTFTALMSSGSGFARPRPGYVDCSRRWSFSLKASSPEGLALDRMFGSSASFLRSTAGMSVGVQRRRVPCELRRPRLRRSGSNGVPVAGPGAGAGSERGRRQRHRRDDPEQDHRKKIGLRQGYAHRSPPGRSNVAFGEKSLSW